MKLLVILFTAHLIIASALAQTPSLCMKNLAILARQADAIVTAEVMDIGPAPVSWSGYIAAQQTVKYGVTKLLKGDLHVATLTVDYYVVSGSRLTERYAPELSHILFKKGSKVVVFLRTGDVKLPNGVQSRLSEPLSTECSVLPWSEQTTSLIEREIRKSSGER
jgi:hypothetical protein